MTDLPPPSNKELATMKLSEQIRDASAKVTWCDISTAPKDGSDMILAKYGWSPIVDGLEPGSPEWRERIFNESAPREYRLFWLTQGHWSEDWENWNDGSEPCGLAEPTHWRPLPEMPRHEQTAWLIERRDLRDETLYFAYRGHEHYWTPDASKAWGFPDEETAESCCNGGNAPGGVLTVAEHAWVSAPPSPNWDRIIAALEAYERGPTPEQVREACARVCADRPIRIKGLLPGMADGAVSAANQIEAAIRAIDLSKIGGE